MQILLACIVEINCVKHYYDYATAGAFVCRGRGQAVAGCHHPHHKSEIQTRIRRGFSSVK
jgi:hypothetical protein